MTASSTATSSSGSQNERKPRTLVLCFDGTADQYDGFNTNVVKLFALLNKDESEQLCYYQPGIGTYFNPGVVSPLFEWAAKVLDEAVAWYLDAHVRGGYQFLMQNYRPGDKIIFFGFSRGAYAARAVAGMVHKVGILPKDNLEQLPFAYKLYTKTDAASLVLAEGFKRTFCKHAEIEFIGVWETVASVGVLISRTLPFIDSNKTIKTFRQALSLDEHRARFRPNLYHYPAPDPKATEGDPEHATSVNGESHEEFLQRLKKAARHESWKPSNLFGLKSSKTGDAYLQSILEGDAAAVNPNPADAAPNTSLGGGFVKERSFENTDVLEVWFAGCHSDVGGSSTPGSTKLSLSDITLRWMIQEVIAAQCGVIFDSDALRAANIPDSVFASPTSPSRDIKCVAEVSSGLNGSSTPAVPPSSATLESLDAVQPIYDQLVIKPTWWLLEIVPVGFAYQDAEGTWHNSWTINLGRGRLVYAKPKFHVTVKERMADKSLKYTPRARWTHGTEVYVS